MVFRDLLDSSDEAKLNDVMNNIITGNIWLTLLYQRFENTTKYYNIISISNNTKTLKQEINFAKTNQIIENYDLEGMKLYSNTLSWAPYFMISNCDEIGKNCEMKGFLNDYMNAMGKILNFTWTSHIDIDGNWGVIGQNGVPTGVMGSVIKGEYHLSLSQWLWRSERYGLMDFVTTTTQSNVLALTPQPAEVDFGLFIRPFQLDAWFCILGLFVSILITILGPYVFINYYEQTEAFKFASLSTWLFFLIINAYYGGALTMFFTSELTIPFDSIEDVMRSYPDWNLKFMEGNDVHFFHKAKSGDALYSAFWNRVTDARQEFKYKNAKEGLDILKKERTVIHITEGVLKGYFHSHPFHQQELKVFARSHPEYEHIIVPLNSPLKPILQSASTKLIESGIKDTLLNYWVGKSIQQTGGVEVMVLTTGQVILIFLVILATFGCSVLILCCEIGHKRISDVMETRHR